MAPPTSGLSLFDFHGFDENVVIGAVHAVGLDAGDVVEDFEALVELAEHGVAVGRAGAALVVVEEVDVVTVDDEELAADGVRHGGLGPAEGAAHVGEARIVAVADGGARTLGGVATGTVAAGEVAALDHETGNDAMERGAVVLALLGELDEVRCAFADAIDENAEFHHAVVRCHDGDCFACLRFVQLVKSHVYLLFRFGAGGQSLLFEGRSPLFDVFSEYR